MVMQRELTRLMMYLRELTGPNKRKFSISAKVTKEGIKVESWLEEKPKKKGRPRKEEENQMDSHILNKLEETFKKELQNRGVGFEFNFSSREDAVRSSFTMEKTINEREEGEEEEIKLQDFGIKIGKKSVALHNPVIYQRQNFRNYWVKNLEADIRLEDHEYIKENMDKCSLNENKTVKTIENNDIALFINGVSSAMIEPEKAQSKLFLSINYWKGDQCKKSG